MTRIAMGLLSIALCVAAVSSSVPLQPEPQQEVERADGTRAMGNVPGTVLLSGITHGFMRDKRYTDDEADAAETAPAENQMKPSRQDVSNKLKSAMMMARIRPRAERGGR